MNNTGFCINDMFDLSYFYFDLKGLNLLFMRFSRGSVDE